jgi:hypothetical protein
MGTLNRPYKETHQDRIKILEGIREGEIVTHVYVDTSSNITYLRYDDEQDLGYEWVIVGKWRKADLSQVRLLSDIQQMVDAHNKINELIIENKQLHQRIYAHDCKTVGAPIPPE